MSKAITAKARISVGAAYAARALEKITYGDGPGARRDLEAAIEVLHPPFAQEHGARMRRSDEAAASMLQMLSGPARA